MRVKQALRRAGYHATFMCRPPFPNIMSSGWHLHQSLVDAGTGRNAFRREQPAPGSDAVGRARTRCPQLGEHYLAGLLQHARGMAVFCTPTANGFGRFRPNALAPQSVLWGRDNRGAMLRVIGDCGDEATRIENRIGEPAANPYLYLASQVHAGLDGIARRLKAPPATDAPYAGSEREPAHQPGRSAGRRCAPTRCCARPSARTSSTTSPASSSPSSSASTPPPTRTTFQRREYFGRI